MSVPTNPSSSLAEVIRCVRDIFAAMPSQLALPASERVTITIGKRPTTYEGAPPRVHFRPDENGTWGDVPTGMGGVGYEGGAQQGCSVFVWGPGDADDFAHYDGADALVFNVWSALMRAARGRVSPATFGDPSKKDEETYGQTYLFRFTYACGIQRNREIWSLPANPIAPSPPDISRPPGTPASVVLPLSVTVTPEP